MPVDFAKFDEEYKKLSGKSLLSKDFNYTRDVRLPRSKFTPASIPQDTPPPKDPNVFTPNDPITDFISSHPKHDPELLTQGYAALKEGLQRGDKSFVGKPIRANQLERWGKDYQKAHRSGMFRREIVDPAISLLGKGIISAGETAIGTADIATGGRAGKFLEEHTKLYDWQKRGMDFQAATEAVNSLRSPEARKASEKVSASKGWKNKFEVALENPSVVVDATLSSIPSMVFAWAITKKIAPLFGTPIAAGIGEGLITAAQNAEQTRENSKDRLLSAKQIAIHLGSGALTGAIGALSAGLSEKLGFVNVDALFGSKQISKGVKHNIIVKVLGGFLQEGGLEELPQSMQEQMAQNLAEDKSIMDGVDEAGVMGFLSGGLMGGVVNARPMGKVNPVKTEAPSISLANDIGKSLRTPNIQKESVFNTVINGVAKGQISPDDLTKLHNEFPELRPTINKIQAQTIAKSAIDESPILDMKPEIPARPEVAQARQEKTNKMEHGVQAEPLTGQHPTVYKLIKRANSQFAKDRENMLALPKNKRDWTTLKALKTDIEAAAYKGDEKAIASLYRQFKGKRNKLPNPIPAKNAIPEHLRETMDTMVGESQGSETKGVSEQNGELQGFSASSPQWMVDLQDGIKASNKGLKEADKADSFSRKEIANLINKRANGEKLTENQEPRYQMLERTAEKLRTENPVLRAQDDIKYMEDKGFKTVGDDMAAGDLKPGDKFFGKVNGVEDEFTHKGFDKDGKAIVQDGTTKHIDPFETIKVDGIKRGKIEVKDGLSFDEFETQYEGTLNIPTGEVDFEQWAKAVTDFKTKYPEWAKQVDEGQGQIEPVYNAAHEAGQTGEVKPNPDELIDRPLTKPEQQEFNDSYEAGKAIQENADKIKEANDASRIRQNEGQLKQEVSAPGNEGGERAQEGKENGGNNLLEAASRGGEQGGVKAEAKQEAPVEPASEVVEKPKPAEGEKQPWKTSDLATTPNISINRVIAKKQPNDKFKLFYTGTRNEVFTGEEFNSVSEARNFFKVQQIKAQEAITKKVEVAPEKKEPWQMTRKEYYQDGIETNVANGISRKDSIDFTDRKELDKQHRSEVLMAIFAKKSVPAEVLKDYPELTKTAAPKKKGLSDKFKARMAEFRAQKEAARKTVENERVPSLINNAGDQGAIVHPSTKEPGRWQVTRWDSRGFSGDTTLDTKDKAIDTALEDGYRNADTEGVFNEIAKTDAFSSGPENFKKAQQAVEAGKQKTPAEMEAAINDFFAADKLPGYKKALKTGKMPNGRVITDSERRVIRGEIDKIEGKQEESPRAKAKREAAEALTAKKQARHTRQTEKGYVKGEPLFQAKGKSIQLDPKYAYVTKEGVDETNPEQVALQNTKVEILQKLWDEGIFSEDITWALRGDTIDELREADIESALQRTGDNRDLSEIYQEQLDLESKTAEEFEPTNDVFEYAEKVKGITENLNEAGYILPDGTLLDFSGKREGGPYGERAEDHRQLGIPMQGDASGSDAMITFQKMGAARIDNNSHMVDLETMPTPAQFKVIEKVLAGKGYVDLNDGKRPGASIENNNTRKTLGLIRRYYNGEDVGNQILFQSRKGQSTQGEPNALYNTQERDTSAPKADKQRFGDRIEQAGFTGAQDTIVTDKVKTKTQKAAQAIGKKLGLKVYFFRSGRYKVNQINGVMFPEVPNVVYINESASNPYVQVLGHEIVHSLKRTQPDLYEFLDKSLKGDLLGFNEYYDKLNAGRIKEQKVPYKAIGHEELYGDFLGDQATTKEFYDKLAGVNPSFAKRIAEHIKTILDNIVKTYGKFIRKTDVNFKDIEKARDTMAKVVGEMGRRQAIPQTGVNEFAQAPSFSVKQAAKNVTDNPKFVKWFGKSRVMGEDGKPLVVYHASHEDFNTFEPNQGVIWFADEKSLFEDPWWNTKEYEVYLSIENPLDITDATEKYTIKEWRKIFSEAGLNDAAGKLVFDSNLELGQEYSYSYIYENNNNNLNGDNNFAQILKQNGYDGIFAPSEIQDEQIFQAFDPTQIKSIFNNGEYSQTDPNILHQMAGISAIGAPNEQLAKAQKMLAKGENEKKVWKETGWIKGVEGKYRFEIDDSGATITKDWPVTTKDEQWYKKTLRTLTGDKNIYDLPENDQPRFKRIARALRNELTLEEILQHDVLFEHYPDLRSIRVGNNTMGNVRGSSDAKNIDIRKDLPPEQLKKTLFHEVQHVIQHIEGFTGGASGLEQQRTTIFGRGSAIAGEIEARDTAARAKLTPEQRREQMPYESQGISREDWIVTDGKGTSFNVSPNILHQLFQTKPIREYGPKIKNAIDKPLTDFMYWMVDKNIPFEKIQKRLKNVGDDINVFLKETNRPKRSANRVKQAWEDDIKPMLEQMAKDNISVPDLEEYAHALHAPEANKALEEDNSKMKLQDVLGALPKKQTLVFRKGLKDFLTKKRTIDKHAGILPPEWLEFLNKAFKEFGDNEKVRGIKDKWDVFAAGASGMTDKRALEVLVKYSGDKKIEKARLSLANINRSGLDTLYKAGLLAPEEYKAYLNKYKFYVPLHREGFDNSTAGAPRGLMPAGRPVKTRGGSLRDVVNIVSNSVSNYERALNLAEKAISQRTLLKLVAANQDAKFWKLKKEKKIPRHDKYGNLAMYPDLFNVAPNEFRIMANGKQYLLEVDRDDHEAMLMVRTLKASDAQHGPILNTFAKVNRWLAQINTSWSPEFMFSNLPRDFQMAMVNIQDTGVKGKKMLGGAINAIKAIYAVETGKPTGSELEGLYARFKKAGGKIGWADVHGSVENLSKKITTEIDTLTGKRPIRKTVKGWLNWVESANTAVENGTRLHVFKLAVESGLTDERGAQIASDITVDFTKKGAAGPIINSLYLFANAGIQGTYRIFRAGAKSAKVRKTMAEIVAFGFITGLLNSSAGDDKDGQSYYDKMDDFLKERNAIFMIPGTEGKFVKIPLPWGYNFFYNIGTETASAFTKQNYSPLHGAARLISVFANAFNPVAAGTLFQTVAPTVADPFIQVAENKNWFGGPLMPEENKFAKVHTPESQKYWRSVRTPSKWVAQEMNKLTGGDKIKPGAIDVSPEALDLIIDTAGGSMLRFFTDSGMLAKKIATGEERQMFEYPIIRRFTGDKSEWADSRIYQGNLETILTVKAQLKAYAGSDYYDKVKAQSYPERAMFGMAKNTESKIRLWKKIRARAEEIGNKSKVKRINEKIKGLYLKFNMRYFKLQKSIK